MKTYLIILLFAGTMFASCSSTQQQETLTDSTELDTMNDSSMMDTIDTGTLPVDTINRDTI